MSVFDPSMEPMIEVFIYETTTLLEQLDEILLAAEKSQHMTGENVNEIFRVMHTIKGSSAMMGLSGISNLTHHLEDMFFIIREDETKLHARNGGNIFDLLFRASDFLKSEVEHIQQDAEYLPADATALTKSIEQEIVLMKSGGAPESDAAAAQTAPASEAAASDAPAQPSAEDTAGVYNIRVFFDEDCQMENIRAFMLLSQLKDLCESIESDPPNPESNSQCSNDINKNGFLLRICPARPMEDIYAVIENSVNIRSYVEEAPADAAAQIHEDEQGTAVSADSPAAGIAEDPASAAAATATQSVSRLAKQSLISVNQSKLDQLMDIMGEIVIAESMVTNNPELKGLPLDNFYKSTRQLRKLTDQLQDIVMSIRMVPLSGVFQKMTRIVRDMNKKLGKEVELVLVGGETEVDKTINDVLADPFMHMIRNSMDHAIESPEDRIAQGKSPKGTVTLTAQNLGGEIIITVADDGRGLNKGSILKRALKNGMLTKPEADYTEKEIFNMIMLPGFSTNEVVTEFSGRGVGMDVVRKNIENVNGSISVESTPNVGTTFTIKIPLTLAIVDGMVVTVGKDVFTIPITSIKQTFKLSSEIQMFRDTEENDLIMLRGDCYPVIRIHQTYQIETETTNLEEGIFILVENEKKSACIFVDALVGEQQVVVKPFPSFLARYDIKSSGLAGCTIMGDGGISLILDVNNFLDRF